MGRKGSIVVRAAGASYALSLTTRDIHLLDGRHFFRDGWAYRKIFGLDFIKGLKSPPLGVLLVTHGRMLLLVRIRDLLVELETQRDLISFDYSYSFDDQRNRRCSGGESGFRVEGGYGFIDSRPAGYCDLTISDVGPNGRGRVFAIIDMRVRRQYETLDRGMLRVHSRKAAVGWFDKLPELIEFLERQSDETVEILHMAAD
jgi:hypothetical protein